MALAAAPGIPAVKLAILVKTWLEVLAEFEPAERDIIFRAYCNELASNSSQLQSLDLNVLTDAFLSLPTNTQQVLSDSIHEVMLSIPRPQRILEFVPPRSLSALGMRR
jgi:hypothetical protein